MNRFWVIFFTATPLVAIALCIVAPGFGWWFPGPAMSPLGRQIDSLFYLILGIVTLTFVGTHIAISYVLYRGSKLGKNPAWHTHGSHSLEILWSIAPAGILLFISLYQMDVWMQYRVQSQHPHGVIDVAEVTARQFEWRIRYPAAGRALAAQSDQSDLFTVNDIRVPAGRPVQIRLRTADVQHSFFLPELRVKQDAVPGHVIPVWFEATKPGEYALTCTELCGWGHYKMRGRVLAVTESQFSDYIHRLSAEQSYDGIGDVSEEAQVVVSGGASK